MDAPLGFEPRLSASKANVLPLDDGAEAGPGESNPLASAYSTTCVHSSGRLPTEASAPGRPARLAPRFPALRPRHFATTKERLMKGFYPWLLPVFALAGCADTKRIAEALPTPPERLICEPAGTRPTVPPEYVIDWNQVRTIAQAKAEHEKFVAVLRTREGIVAGYILKIENANFLCWSNMQWRRDYEAGLSQVEPNR